MLPPLPARSDVVSLGFTTRLSGDFLAPDGPEKLASLLGGVKILLLRQVHGVEIVKPVVENHLSEGDGWAGRPEKGVFLGIKTADCLPLLVFDPTTGLMAAIHAGWRSAVGEIAAKALSLLASEGAELKSSLAFLGPALGPCCFEVGPEVAEAGKNRPEFFRESGGGKFHFDLPGYVAAELLEGGMERSSIYISGLCTKCGGDLFFSHRRGDAARMCAFIGV